MTATKILAAVLAAGTVALAAAPSHADSIDRRQANQDRRIEQGLRSGQLTRAEAARLEAQQARVRALERSAERDGRVDAYERARINAAQNAASRSIYAEKHDRDSRWNRWNPWTRWSRNDGPRRWW